MSKMSEKDIVSTFKGSTNKLKTFDEFVYKGEDATEVFKILMAHNCIDGRLFRQGRYKDEWFQAKREAKDFNNQNSEEAVISLNQLKKENAKLKKQLEKSQKDAKNSQENEIPESYKKTIEAQQEEIQNLNKIIEDERKSHQEAIEEITSSERVNDSLAETNDALMAKIRLLEEQNDGALVEDLRSSISAKEDEIRELNSKISDITQQCDEYGTENVSLSEVIEGLKSTIEIRDSTIRELSSRIQSLRVQSFNESADEMVAQSKLKTLEDKNAKLLERIRGLEEENEGLKHTNCDDDIKRQLSETTQNYNESMLINKKLEEQISLLEEENESDGHIIVDQAKKVSALEKKLSKIEQYVLELTIYDQV